VYLAIVRDKDITHFVLRHSFYDKERGWLSEDIIDLGRDPEEFVEYIDERIFYISDEVQDAILDKGIEYEYEELEEIFWPFIDPYIKQRIDDFGGIRGRAARRKRRFSKDELRKMQHGIHPFDRRRMLFLKFLQINLDPLMDMPLPFLNKLLYKSRDELEQNFEFMELELRPWELKGYLYAIFGLYERFAPRLTRFIPDAQNQILLDEYFLEELCRLNSDMSYLDAGIRPKDYNGLHPYLRRYLIYYFDHAYKIEMDSAKWINRPAEKKNSFKENLLIMELSEEEFKQMSKRQFISFFRKKAKRFHPDKGGDHYKFIQLKEAFEILVEEK